LEDRTLLTCGSYTAATVSELINDINTANKGDGGTSTITLTAATTSPYVLTAVDNSTDGPTGLPVIKKGDTLTIIGNGDTIERSSASGTPDFRLFDVASSASLTLETVTLQSGLEVGSGNSAEGGALYNQGTLVLSGVTVQDNIAEGSTGTSATKTKAVSAGADAQGGGIWSNGTLTLETGTTIQFNLAIGGTGGVGFGSKQGGQGGNAFGAGIYVAGGTANLTGVTLSGNQALGGQGGMGINLGPLGGPGGDGFGGGMSVAGGTVTLNSDTVQNNVAAGGSPGAFPVSFISGGSGGGIYIASGATVTLCNDTVTSNSAAFPAGGGGGIYIASGATVYIDSFTVANAINNTDGSGTNSSTANIDGSYILQNC
jgi:hypothetical protein